MWREGNKRFPSQEHGARKSRLASATSTQRVAGCKLRLAAPIRRSGGQGGVDRRQNVSSGGNYEKLTSAQHQLTHGATTVFVDCFFLGCDSVFLRQNTSCKQQAASNLFNIQVQHVHGVVLEHDRPALQRPNHGKLISSVPCCSSLGSSVSDPRTRSPRKELLRLSVAAPHLRHSHLPAFPPS